MKLGIREKETGKGVFASINILKGHSDFLSYQIEVSLSGSARLLNIWFQIVDQVLSL